MKQVCWVGKLEDGIRRDVRVSFIGRGKLKWQFKRSDAALWDYDSPPTAEDWSELERRVDAAYQRRHLPYKHLELIRALRSKA